MSEADRVVRCELKELHVAGRVAIQAIMPLWSALMISRSFSAALVAAVVVASSPVLAKSKAGNCTDDGLAKADAAVMKMADGENKTMAMQELTSAKSSMSQKDVAGCSSHMNKAMKMTTMKPKKM
jgi:hypothetical protein